MKGFLIFIAGAVIGAIVTFGFAASIGAGAGAGVGIATGLKAGACLTVEAAKEKGYITAEQVNEVLAEAGKQIASGDYAADTADLSSGDVECEKFIAELKAAAAKSGQ
jgi:hypothetical protein